MLGSFSPSGDLVIVPFISHLTWDVCLDPITLISAPKEGAVNEVDASLGPEHF